VLAEAHAAGRIHGNLTSSSIQLKDSSAPEVTIQGFGDQVINDASSHNAGLVGNAGNLAPERIAGGPPTIAADIYSFGGILEQIRSATSFDAVTDREWDTAVSRCVDPAPGRRFHSVENLLQAIRDKDRTSSLAASMSSSTSTMESPKRWG
jgi:eukaryotic-like serine/threonine-protein kinase